MICPHCGKPISRVVNADTIARIIKLKTEGHSCRDVAEIVGVSYATVSRIFSASKRKKVPNDKP